MYSRSWSAVWSSALGGVISRYTFWTSGRVRKGPAADVLALQVAVAVGVAVQQDAPRVQGVRVRHRDRDVRPDAGLAGQDRALADLLRARAAWWAASRRRPRSGRPCTCRSTRRRRRCSSGRRRRGARPPGSSSRAAPRSSGPPARTGLCRCRASVSARAVSVAWSARSGVTMLTLPRRVEHGHRKRDCHLVSDWRSRLPSGTAE